MQQTIKELLGNFLSVIVILFYRTIASRKSLELSTTFQYSQYLMHTALSTDNEFSVTSLNDNLILDRNVRSQHIQRYKK
jgi:hypothetical protein